MTQLTENIFAIQVPVDSYEHFINRDIIYWDSESNSYDFVELPPGTYSFICASLTATEDDAAKLINWEAYSKSKMKYKFENATEALQTIMRSKGLNPELNYAILRKQF